LKHVLQQPDAKLREGIPRPVERVGVAGSCRDQVRGDHNSTQGLGHRKVCVQDFEPVTLTVARCTPLASRGAYLYSAPRRGSMLVLGIESSCDETGVAMVQSQGDAVPTLLAHALHSQIEMHQAFGGVVPELASRDHIRRVLPLTRQVLAEAGRNLQEVDVVAYTRGPGLAGALLVGAGVACALGAALRQAGAGGAPLEGICFRRF